jgi:thiosulfate dehydrogenase [quinone] large subunit
LAQITQRGNRGGGTALTIPAISILPLRFFLGVTFVYAAFQKRSDPGFFNPKSTSYIGSQIQAFSRNSPIHLLLQIAQEHPILAGASIITAELFIGAAITLGLFTRPAAIGGLIINITFFLSASWSTYPYFLGSDIVFVVAWLTLILTGPGPFALDNVFLTPLRTADRGPRRTLWVRLLIGPEPTHHADSFGANTDSGGGGDPKRQHSISRAEAIAGGAVAAAMVVLGLLPRVSIESLASGSNRPRPKTTPSPTKPSKGGHRSKGGHHGPTFPPGESKVGNTADIAPNGSLIVNDPQSGQPDIIIRTQQSEFVAFSAICTHAGCEVGYDPNAHLIVCPCHGSEYDPTNNAAVVAGPAPAPLPAIALTIADNGDIYIA